MLKENSKSKKSIFKNPFSIKTKKLAATSEDGLLKDAKLGADSQELPEVESSHPLFVAKYDYVSRTDDDLGFNKGDLLYILNTDDSDWWFARAKLSNKEGYIPSNHVAELNSLNAEE